MLQLILSTSAAFDQEKHRPRFPGKLYFYRARYYSPALSRFISQDPAGLAGSGPNFYWYAEDDPEDFVDPTGLESGATMVQMWGVPPSTQSPGEAILWNAVPTYGDWGGPNWSGGWRPLEHGGG